MRKGLTLAALAGATFAGTLVGAAGVIPVLARSVVTVALDALGR